jgi:YD repeat-containing protein
VFDAKGFQKNRDYFSQLPFEHIDTLTGNLVLTFTDIVLPGNAGMDLKIQRTFNLNAPGQWTFGIAGVPLRIRYPNAPIVSPEDTPRYPIVVSSDGAEHQSTPDTADWMYGNAYITADFWRYDRSTHRLLLPNGWEATFSGGSGTDPFVDAYIQEIHDPFGNSLTFAWEVLPSYQRLSTVTQDVGAQTRQIVFGYSSSTGDLPHTISTLGRTWTYEYTTDRATVQPPLGPPWLLESGSDFRKLTTPFGGWIRYTVGPHQFEHTGSVDPLTGQWRLATVPVVIRRETGGLDISAGTWTYDYINNPSTNPCGFQNFFGEATVVTSPTGRRLTYYNSTLGGGTADQPPIAPDLGLYCTLTEQLGSVWAEVQHERLLYTTRGVSQWGSGSVPLVQERRVTRNGREYVTTYGYSTANFGDYHQPSSIDEVGELARHTTISYEYDFIPWIRGRVRSQTVTVGSESFVKEFNWNRNTGFQEGETLYGIHMGYGADARGNRGSATDAHNHTTVFTYEWGVPKNTTTPLYTVAQAINSDGTVASRTQRGVTSSFAYDAIGRLTAVTPPIGLTTTLNYGNPNAVTITRGTGAAPSQTTILLDGFGRKIGTDNTVNLHTRISHDADGRKTYESYPFDTINIGTNYQYDALDRLTRLTNADGSFVRFDLANGIDVWRTDEEGRVTIQDWSAFGDPSAARLVGIIDGENHTFTYEYNALGRLTKVNQPGAPARQWTFWPGTDLLKDDIQPESGTTSYTYDTAGRLATKHDAKGSTFAYGYDANDRNTLIDAPGTSHDVSMSYDASDNRLTVVNGSVSTSFEYDGGNRLTKHRQTILGQIFDTTFSYDDSDNLKHIGYASGRSVDYDYDRENRLTRVMRDPSATLVAQVNAYHPSGGIKNLQYGSGLVETFAYNAQTQRLEHISGGPLDLLYGYDHVGNVRSITDSRSGMSQTVDYDHVDRLKNVQGCAARSYTYDALGNRWTKSTAVGTVNYTYDPATLRQMSLSGGGESDSMTYDANGNRLTSAGVTYTYTPFNMIETVTTASGGATYRYDGDNERAVRQSASSSDYFIHHGGQLLSEFQVQSGVLSWTRDNVYLGTRLVATIHQPTGPAVRFDQAVTSVLEDAGSVTVTVRLDTPTPLATSLVVHYATQNGTAVASADYAATSGTVTFPAGSASGASQLLTVSILNDSRYEADESFSIVLSDATGGAIGLPAATTITIMNMTPRPTDFNGDLKADLVWQHDTNGSISAWFMNGTVMLDSPLFVPGQVSDPNWRIVGTADMNGDGQSDLIWQDRSRGFVRAWLMSGIVQIGDVSLAPTPVSNPALRIAGTGDFNADGHPDLVWQEEAENGALFVWLMNGTTFLQQVPLTPGSVGGHDWKIRGVADMNSDGKPDLIWQHLADGWISTWLMNGTTLIDAFLLSPAQVSDPAWVIRATGLDMNDDGRMDLIWQHDTGRWLSVWFMNGTSLLDSVLLTPNQVSAAEWKIVGPK